MLGVLLNGVDRSIRGRGSAAFYVSDVEYKVKYKLLALGVMREDLESAEREGSKGYEPHPNADPRPGERKDIWFSFTKE